MLGGADAPEYHKDEALGAAAGEPAFIVFPASTAEVAAMLRVAAKHHVPVTARGSGTGMSGGAIPAADAVVVAFSRMIRSLRSTRTTMLPLCSPGGMRAVRYGVTRQHVLGVQAVLASGEVIRTGGKIVKCSPATT